MKTETEMNRCQNSTSDAFTGPNIVSLAEAFDSKRVGGFDGDFQLLLREIRATVEGVLASVGSYT